MPFLGANGLAGGPTSGPKYAPPKPAPAPSRPGMLSALPAAIAHALSRAAPALRHVAATATHSSASAGHTATHAPAHASAHASGRLAAAIAAGIQRDPNNPFEVMREAGLMGGDPFARYPYPAYPSPEIWNFSQPEYSPQGGLADPLPSLTGHLYDVLPAKAGTAAEPRFQKFGDFEVKPIPLAHIPRGGVKEAQKIHGLSLRQEQRLNVPRSFRD